jgi:hypothetical protein
VEKSTIRCKIIAKIERKDYRLSDFSIGDAHKPKEKANYTL